MKSGYRARQNKRTNKKRGPGVRGLQARTGEANLQAQPESMPQPQSAGVAETDRTNKQKNGGKMGYRTSFLGTIKEHLGRIKEHKTTIVQWCAVAGIAVIISAVMLLGMTPSKSAFVRHLEESGTNFAIASAHITKNAQDIAGILALGSLATATDLETIGDRMESNALNIAALRTRLELAEDQIRDMEADLASPLAGYLTGSFGNSTGNYTLHAKCDVAGNFTANVHLVYSPPIVVGNTTYGDAVASFYGGINWTEANRSYVPTIAYNGTDWLVSRVSFNVGIFGMAANTETAIDIIFAGLNSTYEPDFAYVEIYPVLK